MRSEPGNGEFDQRVSSRGGKLEERFDDGELLIRDLLEAATGREAASLRGRLAATVLPGEETAGERKVGEKGKPLALAFRDDALLRFSFQEVVLVLDADKPRRPCRDRGFRLPQLLKGKIRAADLPHLAGAHQVV